MRYYLSAGKAIPGYAACDIRSHREFSVEALNLQLPEYSLKFSGQQKKNYAKVRALIYYGSICYEEKNFLCSDLCWQQALEIAIDEGFDYEELHNIRPALNNNCFLSGNFSRAMRISSEGLMRAEQKGDRKQAAHFNNVIGCIHLKLKSFNECERYFRLYWDQGREMKDTLMEAHALYNMADLALARRQYDSSIYFAYRSLEKYELISKTNNHFFTPAERKAYIVNKMAEASKLKGDLSSALQFALEATYLSDTSLGVNLYDRASYKTNTGDIYFR